MRKVWFLIWLLASTIAVAESPEEKGLAIAIAADKRDTGFETQTADMIMILRNRKGQESTRYIRTRTLEVESDGIRHYQFLIGLPILKKLPYLHIAMAWSQMINGCTCQH